MESLIFKLKCKPEQVTADVLLGATTAFQAMLKAAGANNWVIKNTAIHSVEVEAAPAKEDEAAKQSRQWFKRFMVVFNDPRSAQSMDDDISVLRVLKGFLGDTNFTIQLLMGQDRAQIDEASVTALEQTATQKNEHRMFKRVQGVVDKIILQQTHRKLGLIDMQTHARVDVTFDKSLDNQVKNISVGQVVAISGFTARSTDAMEKDFALEAKHMSAVNPEQLGHNSVRTVTVDDLKGLLDTSMTGGLGSVEIVDSLRDVFA